MGEAKCRGTFEERKAQAIKRNIETARQRQIRFIRRRIDLLPEEKEKEIKRINWMATLYASAGKEFP
jgi:hypothetical protein